MPLLSSAPNLFRVFIVQCNACQETETATFVAENFQWDAQNDSNVFNTSEVSVFLRNIDFLNESTVTNVRVFNNRVHPMTVSLINVSFPAGHLNLSLGVGTPPAGNYPNIKLKVEFFGSTFAKGLTLGQLAFQEGSMFDRQVVSLESRNSSFTSSAFPAFSATGFVFDNFEIHRATFRGIVQFASDPDLTFITYGGAFNISSQNIFISNSTFLTGSVLIEGSADQQRSWCGPNTTLRHNTWEAPPIDPHFMEPAIRVHKCQWHRYTAFIDSRANYWGDSSGPFSCCSPNARGVRQTFTDASSWCLDSSCANISAPIVGAASMNFLPFSCLTDPLCTPLARQLQFSVFGIMLGLLLISGIVCVAFYILRMNSEESSPLLGESRANSPLTTLSIALNVVLLIAASTMISIVLFTYLRYRIVASWIFPALILVSVVCFARIGCALFNLLLATMFNKSTLYPSVISSSVATFFACTWCACFFFFFFFVEELILSLGLFKPNFSRNSVFSNVGFLFPFS